VIDGARDGIKQCHEHALESNPTLEGRVLVEVVIDRNGAVLLAQDGGSSIPERAVTQCVIDVVRKLTFPGGAATTSFVSVLRLSPF
ncbi:MAG: AgmX/PglI C-terminal domain-containing protein, partial [Polyangiaceae bacterium]